VGPALWRIVLSSDDIIEDDYYCSARGKQASRSPIGEERAQALPRA
jgi:hypothetical protein